MITIHDISFKLVKHFTSQEYGSQYLYRDETNKIQLEKYSNRSENGKLKTPLSFYYIDNDEREFRTIEDLVIAYNEKFKHSEDNPEEEVIYYKVVIKRDAVRPHEPKS